MSSRGSSAPMPRARPSRAPSEVALHERAPDDLTDGRGGLTLVARRSLERAFEGLHRARARARVAEAIERASDEPLDARAVVALGGAAGLREIAERVGERLACAGGVACLAHDVALEEEHLAAERRVLDHVVGRERLLEARLGVLDLTVVPVEAREREEHGARLLAIDRGGEELARVVEVALADLDLAHHAVDARGARLRLLLGVGGGEDRRGSAERAADAVGLVGLEAAAHRLHRDGEREADDARVLLRLHGVDEDGGRGLAHPEVDEHRGDERRRLGRRRVEPVGLGGGREGRDAEQLGVAAEVLVLGASLARRRTQHAREVEPAVGLGLLDDAPRARERARASRCPCTLSIAPSAPCGSALRR